jgi:beta-glucosidase
MLKNRLFIITTHILALYIPVALSWDKFLDPWPWDKLALENINFKPDFLFGTAICEFQNSGDTLAHSNWNRWQNQHDQWGRPRIKNGQKSGKSCDFWNRYKQDIKLMKEIGLKSLRFSIDWSMIEPQAGIFDRTAIQHYHDLCDELLKADIIPMVTLHHFTHPTWFEDLGGFEHEKNISYFVRFSELVFKEFHPKVHLWCTLNEPGIYTFMGYLLGAFPPGEIKPLMAYQVLKNLLQAHVDVYTALKKLPGGDKAQIGFAHQHLVFEPYHKINILDHIVPKLFNPLITEKIFNFFKTGIFEYKLSDIITISYQAPRNQKLLDFIGLNYYSRVLVNWFTPSHRPHELMTDMPYPIFAEGLYSAIAHMAELKVPIYITENGIADASDTKREAWLKKYLFALHQAIQDGYDVRGYYWWSLMDNFEWDMGFEPKFGLYAVNFQTQERILRPGSRYFADIMHKTYQTI